MNVHEQHHVINFKTFNRLTTQHIKVNENVEDLFYCIQSSFILRQQFSNLMIDIKIKADISKFLCVKLSSCKLSNG